MKPSRTWGRLVEGVVLAALAPLVTACAGVTDAPMSQSRQPPMTASPTAETTSALPQSNECVGTVSIGSVSMESGGPMRGVGKVSDEGTFFTCGLGPLISLNKVADNAVTFTAAGAPVTIAKGSSATVGTYHITVFSIDAGTAVIKVVAPS